MSAGLRFDAWLGNFAGLDLKLGDAGPEPVWLWSIAGPALLLVTWRWRDPPPELRALNAGPLRVALSWMWSRVPPPAERVWRPNFTFAAWAKGQRAGVDVRLGESKWHPPAYVQLHVGPAWLDVALCDGNADLYEPAPLRLGPLSASAQWVRP